MQRPPLLLFFLFATAMTVAACKKKTSAAPELDAAASPPPSASASDASAARPRGDGGVISGLAEPPAADASAPVGARAPAPLPLASAKLDMVAIGKTYNSRILWAQPIGNRFWLSGSNVDAYAEGEGPLVKGPDILQNLPYKYGVHSMRVVGAYPHLYALRTKNVDGRMESPEPTIFVYQADDGAGTWKEAQSLGMSWYPHAFVAWQEGALVMTSAIQYNAGPFLSPGETATSLTYVAPDGSLSVPKLALPRDFMAWTADSDGEVLSLLGTVSTPAKSKDELSSASGVHVLRVTKEGIKRAKVQSTGEDTIWLELYWSRVVERGGAALVVPPSSLTTENEWRPSWLSVFVVGDDAKPVARTIAGSELCTLKSPARAGDVVYAIRRCYGGDKDLEDVVSIGPSGKTEKLEVPAIAKNEGGGFRAAKPGEKGAVGCVPVSITVRGADDVWVTGKCGGGSSWSKSDPAVPVLLRRGRPQTPIVIP